MKRFITFAVIVMLTISLFATDAFAGAWTVPKHMLWSELYSKWHWDNGKTYGSGDGWRNGNLQTNTQGGRTWGWVMEPKMEWGVYDWMNLLFAIEYKESKYKEYHRRPDWSGGAFRRKNHGISNIKIGGKVRIFEKPFVLSTQLKAFIYPGYGNNHGDDPAFTNTPAIGNGEDALEWRVLFGKEFYVPWFSETKVKCYGGAETGYRWKNRNVCNDIPFFVEGGVWVMHWLLVKGEVDGYLVHAGTGSIKKRYAIWRVGPVWSILAGDPVAKKGIMFNLEFQYGQTFAGKNTADDQELVLKVQTQF